MRLRHAAIAVMAASTTVTVVAQVPVAKDNILSIRDVMKMLDSEDPSQINFAQGIIWGVSMGDPKVCVEASGHYVIDMTTGALRELLRQYPEFINRQALGVIQKSEELLFPCTGKN
jgi:hypothetical protein